MENDIYHFGIKGMKWGVRRYQNRDGTLTAAGKKRNTDATKVSGRKLKKQAIKSKVFSSENSATGKKVASIRSELDKTKEGKAFKNVSDSIQNIQSAFNKAYPGKTLLFDKDTADWYNNARDAYVKKGKELMDAKKDELAGTLLTDLGYENTKAGREWLKKNKFDEW